MADAVPVRPGPNLQSAVNDGHAALGKAPRDILGNTAPRHHVDEVGVIFAVRVLDLPVAGDADGADGCPLGGVAQLGVGHQTAHDGNSIQHDRFSSF